MLELEYVFFFIKKIGAEWWYSSCLPGGAIRGNFELFRPCSAWTSAFGDFLLSFFSAYRKERGSLSFGMITSFSWRNIMVWNFQSWYVNGSLGHFWSNLLQPTVLLGCFDFLYKIRGVYLCDFVNVYSANHFFYLVLTGLVWARQKGAGPRKCRHRAWIAGWPD